MIARLNAVPAFVDIEANSYNMCPEALEQWFSDNQDLAPKVKAIVPVHLYGQCANMDPINFIAQQHGIPIVEDAAQAIGAGYPGKDGFKKAGVLGDLCCFSFFPSKNLGAMGDGGLVTTNDEALIEKLRMLRLHGSKPKYYHSIIGGNFRLDPLQAAILLVKLGHLDAWHQGRQDNAHYYDESLNIKDIIKPTPIWGRENHIYNQYVVSVPEKRDELRKFLSSAEIGNEVYYPLSFHEQECFQYLGYKRGDFPNSEHSADHTIALPIYPELTHEMQDYVISKLGEFYEC